MRTLASSLLLLALAHGAAAQTVALRGGRVLPMDGQDEIAEGTVLVVDGKVTAVGPVKQVTVPYDATVIDAKGKTIVPGFVLASTPLGLDRANEGLPVMPFLEVGDALDASSLFFEDCLRDGVTTIHVIQGDACLIGGTGRVVRPMGLTPEQLTVRAPSALKLSVGGLGGEWDAVRQRARLREAFAELEDWVDATAEKRFDEEEKKAGREGPVAPDVAREKGRALIRPDDLDDAHRNLYLLTRGQLDAFIYTGGARDLDYAVAMALELGFLERTTFVVDGDGWKAADVLAKAGRPAVLASMLHRETDPLTGKTVETFVPRVFHQAKVPFALLSDAAGSQGERYLWWQAARCVREGLPRAAALAAVTTTPATILGLGERKGSIAVGKDGDLVVLSGDPLSVRTQVEQVLLEGKLVYERSRDWRLRKLVTGEETAKPEAPTPGGDEEKKDDEGEGQ